MTLFIHSFLSFLIGASFAQAVPLNQLEIQTLNKELKFDLGLPILSADVDISATNNVIRINSLIFVFDGPGVFYALDEHKFFNNEYLNSRVSTEYNVNFDETIKYPDEIKNILANFPKSTSACLYDLAKAEVYSNGLGLEFELVGKTSSSRFSKFHYTKNYDRITKARTVTVEMYLNQRLIKTVTRTSLVQTIDDILKGEKFSDSGVDIFLRVRSDTENEMSSLLELID